MVTLKGTTRGLEIQVAGTPSADALGARLTELLAEAPSFFAGSDARVAFEGALPAGALACLEQVAARFGLNLVEVGPATVRPRSYAAVVRRVDQARRGKLAEGTGPIVEQSCTLEPAAPPLTLEDASWAAAAAAFAGEASAEGAGEASAEVSMDGAPIEVALANTAPYNIEAIEAELARAMPIDVDAALFDDDAPEDDVPEIERIEAVPVADSPARHAAAIESAVAHATEAVAVMAAPAATDPAIDPAILAAATAMAEDLALTMAGELIEARAQELAAKLTAEAIEARAAVLAEGMAKGLAEELAEAKAKQLAAVLADELAAVRAPELAAVLADELAEKLAETKAAKLIEARAAELANKLAGELAEAKAARLAEGLAAALAAQLVEPLAEAKAKQLVAAMPPGPRFVVGPVRSGVIVDHPGHVIIIGDVNPGAEVRAEGSIIVLGRLRGVAHAAIGREAGCIVALSLQPQQLRIGRMVARAGAGDRPSDGAEIAYLTGETIVVERFQGRLPSGLAASM
ncbi:MAG TPA: septum site-determining protein MinC [Kofleriaceae bacterium]|nr:septum site-determining protein MinC [Kofleriaceae bacterium]